MPSPVCVRLPPAEREGVGSLEEPAEADADAYTDRDAPAVTVGDSSVDCVGVARPVAEAVASPVWEGVPAEEIEGVPSPVCEVDARAEDVGVAPSEELGLEVASRDNMDDEEGLPLPLGA